MKHTVAVLALLFSIATLVGCSTTPTIGDRMMTQSNNTTALGEQWKDGDKLVKKGNAQVKYGQKLVDNGHDEIAHGKDLIQKGQQMMNESEVLYNNRFPNRAITR